MHTLWQDLRYGAHMLLKTPSFTAVALLTLALGIGANSAIFSVVNSLLLHPLPYRDSDQLAIIWTHSPGANVEQDWPSPGQYSAIKAGTTVFEDIAIIRGGSLNVGEVSTPQRVGAMFASSNLYSILGAHAVLGRVFLPAEDTPKQTPTVVLSHAFWQREFGGDKNVLDKTLMLNGEKSIIVGVMPADFSLNYEVIPTVNSVPQPDIFLPLPLSTQQMQSQGDENYNLLARLKPGATIAQAQSELNLTVTRLAGQFPQRYPASRGFRFSIKPLLEQVVGDIRRSLFMLLAAVSCVLLIACANVANLLLTRAAAREKEIAIRSALGAARMRLIRQLLTESVLLSFISAVLGLVLAYWTLDALRWLSPQNIPRLPSIRMDGRVLAFTTAVALLTGILFGMVPALRSSRLNLGETLKEGARNLISGRHQRLRSTLVVAELALSLVLLISAGLLIRSLVRVQKVNPGFDPKNVLAMRLSVSGTSYQGDRRGIFYDELLQKVRRLPGVESASTAGILPLSGSISWGDITIEGYDASSGQAAIQADQRTASTDYFETMKIPLVAGRFFNQQDTKDSQKVVIVDEKMARTYWPNGGPIGRRLKTGGADSTDPWLTVVGIVGSVKQYDLETDSRVALYFPSQQASEGTRYLVVRTTVPPLTLSSAIAAEVKAMDPNIPIFELKTMDQWLYESLARRRFAMLALGLFAALALLLALVGIYGVMSYSVAQRTSELGIRLALGAQPADVLRLILAHGLTLVLYGVALGTAASFVVTRLLASLLFGIKATDLVTFGVVSGTLICVALLACFIPARRATKVDPLVALRYE
jgi:predicted permease